MKLSTLCIDRPVLATVLSLIIIVAGLMGFSHLNTRFFPKYEQKEIDITASYAGASAELMESSVTTPIEENISGVEGIDYIKSTSAQGSSFITVELQSGYDIDEVANKIRNRVAMTSGELPSSLKPPIVQAGHSGMDLIDIGFTDSHLSLDALRDYIHRYIENQLEQVPGIANVSIQGANQYAMRIWLDPQKMQARNISVDDINQAINSNNIELPAGKIKAGAMNYPITAKTKLTNTEDFANIIVKNADGNVTYLKDIARIVLGHDELGETHVSVNGQPGILVSVFNATDANPLQAAIDLKKQLKQLHLQLPEGMNFTITFDQSVYMSASVHEVYISIVIAIFCVSCIIFAFLGSFRALFIPIVTIPVCLIGAFGIMAYFSFTIDMITLLALTLCIGLVVDDAIVMLENIYRHLEMGETPKKAALLGSQEITFALIAMTLTLTAVYAPIGLFNSDMAVVFKPFAFTLAGAVIISGFVSLTLSPMMCSKLLSKNTFNSRYSLFLERFFERLGGYYQRALTHILRLRIWVVAGIVVIAVAGFYLVKALPFAFMPHEDIGFIYMNLTTPTGSSLTFDDEQLALLANIANQSPGVSSTVLFSSDSSDDENGVYVNLKPFNERKESADDIAEGMNAKIHAIVGLNATAMAPSFGGNMNHQVEFYLMGNGSYLDLYHTAQNLITQLQSYPGLTHLDTDMKFNSQEYHLSVNRELASHANVTVANIDNTLSDFLGGSPISNFDMGGRDYDVYVQADDRYQHSLNAMNDFYVKNTDDKLMPLSNFVTITPVLSQAILSHYNRLRATLISADLAKGYQLGNAIDYLQTHLNTLLPNDTKYAFSGLARDIIDSNSSTGSIFLLSLIFIYLVLAAQFESFLDPLVILLAVPFSMVSGLAALKLVDGSLDIYSLIALITLIGLIAKHGILITQFTNTLRTQGFTMQKALIQAASARLRPILMTTAAMIFGALPLLLASGASANSRREIGAILIAGLLFGTFFSLILVPITYSYMDKLRQWTYRKIKRKTA